MTEEKDRLNMRLLHDDKIALQYIARAEGETLSVLIRKLIRQEIQRHKETTNDNKQTH
ncbi:MAG: hypothetical protein JXR56_03105 [Candidatus Cloacimonetes bacterium]|nr:hypothetical protein [Candidatus Cloacimonadota bacterium]